jgi:hypothetical protein
MQTVLTFLGIPCPAITINITFPHSGKQPVDLYTIRVLIQSNWKPLNML